MQRKIIAAALFALFTTPIQAQVLNPVTPLMNGAPAFTPSNPGNVAGTFTASLGGFHWVASLPPMTNLGTSPVTQAISAGQTIVIQNIGATNSAFCALGGTTSANATFVPPISSYSLTSITETSITCVTSANTTTLNLQSGTGLWTNAGGGGSGGAGGGAVYGPTAVGSAAANPPVLTGGTVDGTGTGNVSVWKIVSGVGYLNMTQWAGTALGAPSAWGTAPTGNVPGFNANVLASVLPTGAATSANQSTEIGSLATIATNSALPLPAQSTHTVDIGAVDQVSPYPAGATPITASATGTTAATTATLAGATGKTTYVCGYSIRANATTNTNVTNTLTGVISGTMSSAMWVPANTAGLGVDEQIFMPCIPASAANTAIAAVSGAPGTGGVVTVKAWGFQQ